MDDIARNSKYAFYVQREGGADQWLLKFVVSDPESREAKELYKGAFLPGLIAPTSAVLLGSAIHQQKRPSELTDDTSFQTTRFETLPNGLLRVHYQYGELEGELDCDPGQHYLIRRGHSVERGPRVRYEMTFERHLGPQGKDGPVVQRLDDEVTSEPIAMAGHWKSETTYTYPDVRKTGELDEERFRLSAYGLPEPAGVEWPKRRSYTWWYLAGAALTALLLAGTFRYLYRRRLRRGPAVVVAAGQPLASS